MAASPLVWGCPEAVGPLGLDPMPQREGAWVAPDYMFPFMKHTLSARHRARHVTHFTAVNSLHKK